MAALYAIDHRHDRTPEEQLLLLGEKGAALSGLRCDLGLDIPPGYIITTETCAEVLRTNAIPAAVAEAITEATTALARPALPLLVSVRPSTITSMPGAAATVLNVGLNDTTVHELAAATGDERFAYDSYRQLIATYGNVVCGLPTELFDRRVEGARALSGVATNAELGLVELQLLVEKFKRVLDDAGFCFPQDIHQQILDAVTAVFGTWNSTQARTYRRREAIPHDQAMAVVVQQMVFGNHSDQSGTGLVFSRNPITGGAGPFGDFRAGGQGIDHGSVTTLAVDELAEFAPDAWQRLTQSLGQLERRYADMVSVDFTIEAGELWYLGVRPGDRSGAAAVRIATQLTRPDDLGLDRADALLTVTADHLDQILHPQFSERHDAPITSGLAASPGAAVGAVYFSADAAVAAYDEGLEVILVKDETSPEDVHGMAVAQGILTTRGGLASHAAVVARGWGKPAVCGAEAIQISGTEFTVGSVTVHEGDVISLDGASGDVFLGAVALSTSDTPAEMDVVLGWADELRGDRIGVRVNADSVEEADAARRYGAVGIGLCRSEHQFLRGGRDNPQLRLIQDALLATHDEERHTTLAALIEAQRSQSAALLAAADGLPVTIRLLDPPLHEFFPDAPSDIAARPADGATGRNDAVGVRGAIGPREGNPMLGTRGIRLGVLRPDLYRGQLRAILRAAADRLDAGGNPQVEIMIPLIVNRQEVELIRRWFDEELAAVNEDREVLVSAKLGSMVETPRSALRAGELASVNDFLSFGTNDLTQMTFGFSRDDVEGSFIRPYCELELLAANPFETLDQAGVGALITQAITAARAAHPDIVIGVCGEHGGDPASIAWFVGVGVDYVSCSPYRVPVARLAAAHAVIEADRAAQAR